MRKAIVTILLALLPFQFVWGAAAEYCQHEGGDQVSHFGHHVHKHHGQTGSDSSGHSTADSKSKPAADDADCISCHLSCALPLPVVPLALSPAELSEAYAPTPRVHAVHVAASIDRPKWASLS